MTTTTLRRLPRPAFGQPAPCAREDTGPVRSPSLLPRPLSTSLAAHRDDQSDPRLPLARPLGSACSRRSSRWTLCCFANDEPTLGPIDSSAQASIPERAASIKRLYPHPPTTRSNGGNPFGADDARYRLQTLGRSLQRFWLCPTAAKKLNPLLLGSVSAKSILVSAWNSSLYIIKAVISGRGGKVVDLAKENLWR
jgi:hypothetical protein